MLLFAAGHYGKFCRGEACFIFRLFTVNIELRALYRRGLSAHPLELKMYMHTRRAIPKGARPAPRQPPHAPGSTVAVVLLEAQQVKAAFPFEVLAGRETEAVSRQPKQSIPSRL